MTAPDGARDAWWRLSGPDAEALAALGEELDAWRPHAETAQDLAALAALLCAIESILAREEQVQAVMLGLTNGGRWDFGLSMDVEMSDDGLALSTLTRDGSDHQSEIFATLTPRGGFNVDGVERWIEAAQTFRANLRPGFRSAITSIAMGDAADQRPGQEG